MSNGTIVENIIEEDEDKDAVIDYTKKRKKKSYRRKSNLIIEQPVVNSSSSSSKGVSGAGQVLFEGRPTTNSEKFVLMELVKTEAGTHGTIPPPPSLCLCPLF